MLKIIHAQPSPDPLNDPDTQVWARVPGWKNSTSVIITTRGLILPSICSLFSAPLFIWVEALKVKFNLNLLCCGLIRFCHLKGEGIGYVHKWWVCYPRRPGHKSSLIWGASCKCQCHRILLLLWSDLWPHTWCQTGSIWRWVHMHTPKKMQSKHRIDSTYTQMQTYTRTHCIMKSLARSFKTAALVLTSETNLNC